MGQTKAADATASFDPSTPRVNHTSDGRLAAVPAAEVAVLLDNEDRATQASLPDTPVHSCTQRYGQPHTYNSIT